MSWSSPTTLASGSGSTGAASQSLSGITATAGTFVVVTGAFNGGSTVTGLTVSDSAGNSWFVHSEGIDGSAHNFGFVAYSILTNALSGGSFTITRTPSTGGNINAWAMGAVSFTGNAPTSPEDDAVFATAIGSNSSPSVTGNAPTQTGDLLIAVCVANPGATTTYTEDSVDGWSNLFTLTPATGLLFAAAYQVDAASSGVKHNPSLNKSQPWTEIQVGFSPAAEIIAIAACGIAAAKAAAVASARTALSANARSNAAGTGGLSLSVVLLARAMGSAIGRSVGAFVAMLFGRANSTAAASSKLSVAAPLAIDAERLLSVPTLARGLAAPVLRRVLSTTAVIRSLKVP